jgi:predicted RecA/RadA family phage recombinase
VFAVTAPAPTVNAIAPFAAAAGNVVLTGQNFLPATTVTLQNPEGQNVPATATVQDGQTISVTAAFQTNNNWTVTVKNPGNNAPATQTFNVT